ncbi:MAG: tetratricopeptide repeat protein [Candidatus Wallbacteria bacterium]|nr:tetratricopeptide repeat protein [Candidatus Wallbacteria bacterium]
MIYFLWFIGFLLFLSVVINLSYFLFYREIHRLERVAEEYPGYADVRYKLGRILHQKGKNTEARRYLEEAIKIYPYYLEAHQELFHVLDDIGDKAAAVQLLIRLKPLAENQHDKNMIAFVREHLDRYEKS